MKLVTIIIPTLNNVEYFTQTLESISINTVGLFRFVIVNQGNKELENYVQFSDPKIAGLRSSKMLHVDKPLGWAGAINYGFSHMHPALELDNSKEHEYYEGGPIYYSDKDFSPAKKRGYKQLTGDYILLMNDDTMILPGNFSWLTDLTNVLECDSKVGAVGPCSNFVAGWQNMRNHYPVSDKPPLLLEVKYLIGFCMLIRRDLFEKLGGLDETLPGGDDLDLSIRIRDAGYKLVAKRDTFVYHFGQITGKKEFGADWDSERHQLATKHAIIRKHGFRKMHECYSNEFKPYEALAQEYYDGNVFRQIVKGKGLDIGCGNNKEPEACGIDAEVDGQQTQADIIGYGDDLIAFKDNSQDYILSRHSIEHFFNPFTTLREWYRVLKPGGKLGIATPDGKRYPSIDVDGDHKHQYDRGTMVELLKHTGFKVIDVDGCKNQLDFYVIAEKI